MEIPSELLRQLKCAQCDGYLSCGPVLKLHSGRTICGRCAPSQSQEDEPSNRCGEFEALATLVTFPCNNREAGCCEKLPFSLQGQPHESMCPYRPNVCPVAGPEPCEWMGTRSQILDHCRSNHPQQVVTNPHTLKHDIRRSSQCTLLLLVGHLLFLLHTKVCLTTKKIFHAVRYLGAPQKVAEFTFFVIASRGSECVKKSGQVAPEGCRVLQEDSSIVISINSLLDIMGGFDGTVFTVRVEGVKEEVEVDVGKCAKDCGRVTSTRVYRVENGGWWCDDCVPERMECQNSENGCTYRDFNYKCRRHQTFHCQFNTKCSFCLEAIPDGTIHQHWAMKHIVATYSSDVQWRCEPLINKDQFCIIQYDGGTALCRYWIYNSDFNLYVYSELYSEQLHKYLCLVEFTHPETKYTVSKQFNAIYDNWQDWFVKINKRNLLSSNTNCIDLKIVIRRN